MKTEVVKYLKNNGVKTSKDGDQWCCLLGENLQEGEAFFDPIKEVAQQKMYNFLILKYQKEVVAEVKECLETCTTVDPKHIRTLLEIIELHP